MFRFHSWLCLLLVVACAGAPGPSGPDAGGPLDSGLPPIDAGRDDAGPPPPDAGSDAGEPYDAGEVDGGGEDAGAPDAGGDAGTDAGPADSGAPDAGLPDAGVFDAGPQDAGPLSEVPFVIEGFGAATRGGWQPGHDTVVVTSLDDSGPGTLREALSSATGPRVITFGLDGTVTLSQSLLVPSNVSIDGRGKKVKLTGKGLILAGSDDVILTNLEIQNVGPESEDGLRLGDPTYGPSERVVVDHVLFDATGSSGDSAKVDEATSVIFGSKDITYQWVRVVNWEKFILIGNGDAPQAVDSAITVSLHHVYMSGTGRRHPQARYGVVDLWNCFFDDWHMFDWFYLAPYRESFGAQSQDGARVRVENSLFRRTPHLYDALSQANDATRCESGGKLDGVGLQVTQDSTAPLVFGAGCTGSTGWARPYPITLEPADAALRQKLITQTGNTL